ncbi:MAG: hypothetical protein PHF46_02700 [Candidatus Gracilibacteria bacterium]|nr:hypothetical protein [Candidatus Gracilibacteria bacterium]MDD3120292.1 hypothetical protein [Candidatus Gracilibacteria bacterium]MDD4530466.1 hypothetical protein [Candidatus Gracilibacteria bacterium]
MSVNFEKINKEGSGILKEEKDIMGMILYSEDICKLGEYERILDEFGSEFFEKILKDYDDELRENNFEVFVFLKRKNIVHKKRQIFLALH